MTDKRHLEEGSRALFIGPQAVSIQICFVQNRHQEIVVAHAIDLKIYHVIHIFNAGSTPHKCRVG